MFLFMDNTVANLLSYVPGDGDNTMETAVATLSDPEHMAERSLSDPDTEHMAEHTVADNTTGETLDTGRRNNSYTPSFPVSYIWVSF